jgi:hypothetical protein
MLLVGIVTLVVLRRTALRKIIGVVKTKLLGYRLEEEAMPNIQTFH